MATAPEVNTRGTVTHNAADLLRRQRESLFPSVALYYENPIEIARGDGFRVWDGDGNEYLDFFGGIVTVISGHAIPEIIGPVQEQLAAVSHTSTLFLIPSQIALAEQIIDRAADPALSRVFFTNSGTEANEAAFTLSAIARGNPEFIALRHSYHGRSFATLAATGQSTWRPTSISGINVSYVGNPYCYRCPYGKEYPSCDLFCAKDVEAVIQTATNGHPAAFIAESVQGVGGFVVPPPEYFGVVKEILDRYGVLYIADEVQTAWGRIGEAEFGWQHFGVTPDMFVFAKGLANGLPIGGICTTDAIAGGVRTLDISTFGGNPISSTGALANLAYLTTHHLRENAKVVGDYLMDRLREVQERHPLVGDVRGLGLMIGVELVRNRATKEPATAYLARVQNLAKERGLVIGKGGFHGNTLRLSPPLTITKTEADICVRVLDEVFGIIEAEGALT